MMELEQRTLDTVGMEMYFDTVHRLQDHIKKLKDELEHAKIERDVCLNAIVQSGLKETPMYELREASRVERIVDAEKLKAMYPLVWVALTGRALQKLHDDVPVTLVEQAIGKDNMPKVSTEETKKSYTVVRK